MMKPTCLFVLIWCLVLGIVPTVASNNARFLRKLDQAPAAAPSENDRESEPAADVIVEDPAPAAAPTTTAESPTVDDEEDVFGNDNEDDNTEPTPAPTENEDDADEIAGEEEAVETTQAADDTAVETTEGEGGDEPTEVEPTEAEPTEAEGGGGDDTETTSVPTEAPKDEITPEPTPEPVETTPEPTPEPADAPIESPTEDEYGESPTNDEDPWENYTPPTEKPVVYVPPDEEEDPIANQTNTGASGWIQEGETPEEMMHDRNVLIAASVLCGVGILLMIITAHQMVENPDGCCASVCRLVYGCTCCIFRTICFPCRAICGCTRGSKRRARQHQMLSDNGNYTHDLELS